VEDVAEDTRYVCCKLCGHTWWKTYWMMPDEKLFVKEIRN